MQKAGNEFSKRENWYILKSSARKLNKAEIAGKAKIKKQNFRKNQRYKMKRRIFTMARLYTIQLNGVSEEVYNKADSLY